MCGGVDGLELLDRNERVDLRGLGVGVAEHLLDEAEIGATLEHESGHSVPERMAGALFPTPDCSTYSRTRSVSQETESGSPYMVRKT